MPTRLLREGIIDSDRVNQLDWPAEVFYRRLMSVIDDYGLFDGRISILRAKLYPTKLERVREADISRWMAECQKAGLILLYEVEGKPYLQVLDTDWQTRSKPKYPLPTESNCKQPLTPVYSCGGGDVSVDVFVKPANAGSDRQAGSPPCPHEEIIALYHETLPTLPKVKVWNETRKSHLKQRWRESPTIDEWREFFKRVGRSKFLTGKAQSKDGRKPFIASLDWLVKPENFAKVLEGKYE